MLSSDIRQMMKRGLSKTTNWPDYSLFDLASSWNELISYFHITPFEFHKMAEMSLHLGSDRISATALLFMVAV
jgi:hypothetical protein